METTKFFKDISIERAGWTRPQYPSVTVHPGLSGEEHCGQGGCLYNIKEDPEERKKLAKKLHVRYIKGHAGGPSGNLLQS